jgi:hypothetical protein
VLVPWTRGGLLLLLPPLLLLLLLLLLLTLLFMIPGAPMSMRGGSTTHT